ncbi:MAG: SMC-Scp complex subunit ScpB [Pirellulales bacterium]|nr:SMC-Scp complex subunit ScpB [Pirellulales bacterium]
MADRTQNRPQRLPRADGAPDFIAEPTDFRPGEDPGGLSLDQLGAAFAQMLDHGHDPYTGKTDANESSAYRSRAEAELEAALDPQQAAGVGDGLCQVTPRSIVEAMLFVGSPTNEPLTAQRIAGLMRGVRPVEIEEVVRELNETYAANRCPYEIVSTGAGYRLALPGEFDALRTRVVHRGRQVRLSESATEVLAVVAYNEPLTAEEVDKLRGRPSGALLRQLLRRQLLILERPDEESAGRGAGAQPRTTPRYRTTPRFLELVGIESLADLPRVQEIEKR